MEIVKIDNGLTKKKNHNQNQKGRKGVDGV
jgi:hypothetical protein